ncbi:Stp1/IreP family PP2C-type Ser/Thr phosphatase [Virgibacillus sp. W0430]|uniref:Stp1/IreP family PP2C-type Ser/Thr phosphatase n=1 Tax=Virgibacillus sp. W0430 TaxID=3391580 RepID=UPI003F48E503
MQGQFLTDRGRIRIHNEDAGGTFYNESNQIIATIADGMGGHQAGDVASKMAISIVEEQWVKQNQIESPDQAETWLLHLIKEINASIYKCAQEKKEYEGMGTTIVIALCTNEFITIAHIGDSRCYLYNEHGFKQITEDHSLVNELVRAGQLSKDDAEIHPRKNVLVKAIGTEQRVEADIQTISWEAGNKVLLCSDGLTNKLSDEELHELIRSQQPLEQLGKSMIDLANDRGGEDNISLAIIVRQPVEGAGESSC